MGPHDHWPFKQKVIKLMHGMRVAHYLSVILQNVTHASTH